ncbi:MAG: helix-turn-helix domain-containing protein [Acidobacteriota bacterium]
MSILKKNDPEKIIDIHIPENVDISRVKKEMYESITNLINNYLLKNCVSERLPMKLFMNYLEEELIKKTLIISKGNQKVASIILGIKASTLNEKIRKYDIKGPGSYKIDIELFHLFQNKERFEQE